MSLADSLRRRQLKQKARRLFVIVKTAGATRFRGPEHALRIAKAETDLAATMRKLAEVDPEAAKLIAEAEAQS